MQVSFRYIENHFWITAILVFVALLLVIAKWNKSALFHAFAGLIFNLEFISKKFSELRRIEIFEVLLFVAGLFGLSAFVYVVLPEVNLHTDFDIFKYFQILFLASIFIISKYLIEKIVGDLFEIENQASKYLFFKQSILTWLSLFLLFPLALIFYFQDFNDPYIIGFCAILAAVIYMFRVIYYLINYQSNILAYSFYFILYLCAFEIAPYIILFKVVNIT
ncbi:DUF4271 domain-containing protein [Psychroflexus aestuariivivens]|uniref:DUF4271 domain-containing protein n=1 Tax=Psychroflexus aestuariivivens TaxID=1795040 RepID=UPI000FDB0629|nr:DUF4271 domain-containing protein [Psychroflexus aestuariivivens]